jgi:hypothetical protein
MEDLLIVVVFQILGKEQEVVLLQLVEMDQTLLVAQVAMEQHLQYLDHQ